MTVAALLVASLGGCTSKAEQLLLSKLAGLDQRAVSYLEDQFVDGEWPTELREFPADESIGLYVWDGTEHPDQKITTGYLRILLYDVKVSDGELVVDVRLRATGQTGGGFQAESAQGYLCVRYQLQSSGTPKRSEVDCAPDVEPGGDDTDLIRLGDLPIEK